MNFNVYVNYWKVHLFNIPNFNNELKEPFKKKFTFSFSLSLSLSLSLLRKFDISHLNIVL